MKWAVLIVALCLAQAVFPAIVKRATGKCLLEI